MTNNAEAAEATHRSLIAQLRGALRLLDPQDITPLGVRVLERILDHSEAKLPPADFRD